jgi:cobalt-zinc-cadmium efflux system outer membrane protein
MPVQSPPVPLLNRAPTPVGPPLSLREAIDESLTRNPTLLALRRELDTIRQRPAQTQYLAPPTLNAQIWQWPINTLNPVNTNMFMFTMEQELPGRGKRDLRTIAVQLDVDVSENEVAMAAQQTVADVKRAYITLFIARKAADVYVESAAILRQLTDVSESKYAAGRISQQDVLKPVVEISKLYDDALVSRQDADLASAQLNVLMGRAPDVAIGPLADPLGASSMPTLPDLIVLAMEHQPGLRAARLAIERAKADLAVAKSDGKPDFMVQGGYMLAPHGIDAWTGQIGVTWPSAPWSRGKLDVRIAETTAAVGAAEARSQAAEAQLLLAVQQAYVRVTTADQRATLLRSTILPQSRQVLDVSRAGYETDRLDLLTLLENQRALVMEQLEYIRGLGELAEARVDLERAVGVDISPESMAVAQGGKR